MAKGSNQTKISLTQILVVEGRYDKIHLDSILDAVIIPTHGFSVFTNLELREFLKKMAKERGLIVLTDSDAAGFKIRSFLRGITQPGQITDVYIPDLFGKEKRKRTASKEGKLGVEGVSKEILLQSFQQAGIVPKSSPTCDASITRLDLYQDGFYGGEDSACLRQILYQRLGLPEHLSVKTLLPLLCSMLNFGEYEQLVQEIHQQYQSQK